MLRVEYMHAHPAAYSGEYIETQVKHVEEIVAAQQKLLKPDPPPNVIADTRTNLEWLDAGLSCGYNFNDAKTYAADVSSTGAVPVLTRYIYQSGLPSKPVYESVHVGTGWRLPDSSELEKLIARGPTRGATGSTG